jgi:hypothetical protein
MATKKNDFKVDDLIEDIENIRDAISLNYYHPVHGGPWYMGDPIFKCACSKCKEYKKNEMANSRIPMMRFRKH